MGDRDRRTDAWGAVALRPQVLDALIVVAVAAAELVNLYREVAVTGYRPPLPTWVVAAWLLAMTVLLLWRRRRPLAVVAVVGVSAAVFAVVDLPTLNLPVLVAVFTAGATLAATTGVAVALFGGVVVVNLLRGTLSQLPIDVVVFGAVWLLGVHLRVRQLHARDLERRRAAERWRERSQERTRLARELHDIVSNGVGGIYLQAVGAAGLLDREPERARAALEDIQTSARVTLDELRTLLDVLRLDPDLGEGQAGRSPAPSLADLPGLVERTRATGASVEVEVIGDPGSLPASVSTAGYRTLQEALGNATRHGADGLIRVRLEVGAAGLHLEVANRVAPSTAVGRAGVPDGAGWGLVGLSERIAALGGDLQTRTVDGDHVLSARLPVREQAR